MRTQDRVGKSASDILHVGRIDANAAGGRAGPGSRPVQRIRSAAGAVLMQAERARSDPPGAPPRSTIVGRAIETLTPRELEVLQLMSRGLDNAAIAERLGVGYTTVRAHVSSIMAKLDARSRLAAVVRALQRGIVQPPTGATGRQERDEERVRD